MNDEGEAEEEVVLSISTTVHFQSSTSSPDDEGIPILEATLEVEEFQYFFSSAVDACDCVTVHVQSATTTRGGNIVSASHDVTGIMIWPATHLLCQCLVQQKSFCNVDAQPPLLLNNKTVLELGCGCGVVGSVAGKMMNLQQPPSINNNTPRLWVSTDVDVEALKLCETNLRLNGVVVNRGQKNHQEGETALSSSGVFVKRLDWSNPQHRIDLLRDFGRFDVIVGADIVYPNTCGSVLTHMLETVDQLLTIQNGAFYLAFCARDGPTRTPRRLVQAATDAGFAIVSSYSSRRDLAVAIQERLPALLDSQILVLQRSERAALVNEALGADEHCPIFPGMRVDRSRSDSSEEEWEAPFSDDILE